MLLKCASRLGETLDFPSPEKLYQKGTPNNEGGSLGFAAECPKVDMLFRLRKTGVFDIFLTTLRQNHARTPYNSSDQSKKNG